MNGRPERQPDRPGIPHKGEAKQTLWRGFVARQAWHLRIVKPLVYPRNLPLLTDSWRINGITRTLIGCWACLVVVIQDAAC